MAEFEVVIECYYLAREQALAEIEEATGAPLPAGTSIELEFADRDGDDMFYTVTVTGPDADRIAASVIELQEPCPPPRED